MFMSMVIFPYLNFITRMRAIMLSSISISIPFHHDSSR